MSVVGKISIRPLSDLISDVESLERKQEEPDDKEILETPKNVKKKKQRKAATTCKRIHIESTEIITTTKEVKTEAKKSRSSRKDPLPGQMRIDAFYKSAAKSYTIPKKTTELSVAKQEQCRTPKKKRRRKALFKDDDSTTTTSDDKNFVFCARKTKLRAACIVDLCTESEADDQDAGAGESAEVNVILKAAMDTIEEIVDHQQSSAATELHESVPDQKNLRTLSTPAKNSTLEEKNEVLSTTKANKIKKRHQNSCKKSSTSKASLNRTLNDTNCSESDTNATPKTIRPSDSKERPKMDSQKTKLNQSAQCTNSKTKSSSQRNKSKQMQNRRSSPRNKNLPLKSTNNSSDPNPMSSTTDVHESIDTLKDTILSPSDSNTSCNRRNSSKESADFDTETKLKEQHKNKKPLTPPDSVNRSVGEIDKKVDEPRTSLLLECSYSADVVIISDEELENVYIPKPLRKSKTRKRGKETPNPPKAESVKITKSPRPCPPYKVVEGTSFAVDAFRYGNINGVTHYFLTHFHADHYIGLNRKFSNPIYMSSITARLLRVFIPIEEQYIKEMELNVPINIEDVEVTAIDANHCPGAVMLVFKTRQGRCILHTGDFRASPEMESEPIFWSNDIHTIYLDTTYFPKKYAFCAQSDSIDRALDVIEEFYEKNVGTRILYVCGSYLIGKEKFWSTIAHKRKMKVWTDANRRKALNAVSDKNIMPLLVDDPCAAHMHVIPMVHLSYFSLVEYIDKYSQHFDIVFALRPSGWEKNSKPQFRGKVNIVGVEYSEHSSHDELKRFVQYLKPQKVISTVPVSQDPMKTARIPDNWYKYNKLSGLQREFQPAITSYFKLNAGESPKTTPENPKFAPKCGDHENEMTISPLFVGRIAQSIEESQKIGKKTQICDVDENDDWLT